MSELEIRYLTRIGEITATYEQQIAELVIARRQDAQIIESLRTRCGDLELKIAAMLPDPDETQP